ncbi:MAG: hypothetical protein JST54_19920 [Deltaproteobacteria bacterium]|nr:hypothetical protein [Deltaproteobacteria bacterium]
MKRAWLLAALVVAGCGRPERDPAFDPTSTSTDQALTVCAAGTTVPGIDVSHWDGTINWPQVADGGQTFVFMKATEGTGFTDPQFATNWQGAKAAGVARGAYHFFHSNMDPIQQADFFLSVAGNDFSHDLPPMLDLEVTDNSTSAVVASTALAWLQHVQEQTGRAPVVYTSARFMTSIGNPSGFEAYPLFVANWQVTCPNVPTPWTNWVFWQSTDAETVPGISGTGNVDGDSFNGDLAGLIALTDGGPPPAVDAGPATTSTSTTTTTGTTSTSSGSTTTGTTGSSSTSTSTTTTTTTTTGGSTTGTTTAGSTTGTSTTGISTTAGVTSTSGSGAPDAGSGASTKKSGCGCGSSGSADALSVLFAILGLAALGRRSR